MTDCTPKQILRLADIHPDLETATYFILQPCVDYGDHVLLASVEDAEENGYFAIHAGMADRPDSRMIFIEEAFSMAIDKLQFIRFVRPKAGLWFSSLEILAQIEHANVARGVVMARGSACPDDDEDEWCVLADHIAKCETSGQPLDMTTNTSPVISTIADRLA